MTTLAGRKIRRYREAQTPKITRHRLADRFGVSFSTVQGWEEDGKVPKPPTMNKVVASGIVQHADWYKPAECARCGRAADQIEDCKRASCPLAVLQQSTSSAFANENIAGT
jgi:transcriptional regulator with XRE-family HTH domain